MSFVYIAMVLGQPIGLSKEVRFYAGAYWLQLIYQSEDGEGSVANNSEMGADPICFSRVHLERFVDVIGSSDLRPTA